MDFDMLGLGPKLTARLTELGLTDPTPIQEQAIPHAMNGRDVMGLAQTGTGKTLAFALPLAHALTAAGTKPAPKSAHALILAPTRELAGQIAEAIGDLTKGGHLKVQIVTGGKPIGGQIQRLARGTDVLVATPGRLIDLMDRRAVDLSHARFLVLDEADQMLDLGFIHALRRIAPALPADRQTMLFSATMSKQMNEIASAYLRSPVRVEVSPPGKAADKVEQHVHFVDGARKQGLLIDLLDRHKDDLALVFGRTKHGSEKLMKKLVEAGFAAASIHGNKSQGQRDRALAAFKSGDVRVLVATDVAARGIDIPGVGYVYNYDLPNVPENYVHRIGRTARAGRDGIAVALCAPDEMGELRDIEKSMGTRIPVASGEPFAEIAVPKKGRGGRPNGGGGRPQGGRGFGGGGKPGGGRPGGSQRRSGGGGRGRSAA